MKTKLLIYTGLFLLTMGLFVGVVSAQNEAIIQGGLLYDKWWSVTGGEEPTDDHPLWATQSTNTRSGADTWRCKECHGWDYMGAEGAYGSGSHFTGFPGVYAARTKSVEEIVAALSGGANPDHDFSAVMDDAALTNLAVFIQGVQDYTQYIDYSTKTSIGGDAANGQVLFEEGCALCHGADGTQINFHDPDEPEYVGTIAVDNPQEFMHKTLYGQPGSNPKMVGAIETGWTTDQVVDVLAYAQTLPTGGEEPAQLPETGGVSFALPLLLVLSGALSLGAGLLSRRKG